MSAARRLVLAAAALVAVAIAAAPAHADRRLAVKRKRDLPIVIVGGVAFGLADSVGKDALSPARCRWCSTDALDRAVRDGLRWSSADTPNTLSNLTAYVAAPVASFGLVALLASTQDRGDEVIDDGIAIAEATVAALGFDYLVKIGVARERPGVHYATVKPDSAENNLSFYSGHSTLAMTLAVSAGTVATLRGYRHARLVWAVGVPVAVATGYLRIAADKHWATDVLTGWAMGAAFGVGVPWLLSEPTAPVPTIGRSGESTTVGVAGVW